jgi:GDPmannose 4,6-dehydratase
MLYLGNLDASRDWGYAPEYVEAMWRMLQQDSPDDYVIGTGTSYSVRDFVTLAFQHVGLDWEKYVEIDPLYFRPAEVDDLRADASKAASQLKWRHSTEVPELVRIMVDAELDELRAAVSGSRVGSAVGESV